VLPSSNNHCKDPAIYQDQDEGEFVKIYRRKKNFLISMEFYNESFWTIEILKLVVDGR